MIGKVRGTLAKSGFYLSEPCDIKSVSFDIICRRDNLLLVIKILANIDSFNKVTAREMKVLTTLLEGSPLLIGKRCGSGRLEDGIVYLRHGIPLMTENTLREFFLEGVPPFIYAAPGGYYVNVDSEEIRRARKEQNLSLGDLAKAVGVSRKAIQNYEEGMSPIVEVALRLEEFLNREVIRAINPFSYSTEIDEIGTNLENLNELERNIFTQLEELGYQVIPTFKCPFDALSKKSQTLILTGIEKRDGLLIKKAHLISNISRVTERHSVVFVEKSSKKNIKGTPLIRRDELRRVRSSEEVMELILERRSIPED